MKMVNYNLRFPPFNIVKQSQIVVLYKVVVFEPRSAVCPPSSKISRNSPTALFIKRVHERFDTVCPLETVYLWTVPNPTGDNSATRSTPEMIPSGFFYGSKMLLNRCNCENKPRLMLSFLRRGTSVTAWAGPNPYRQRLMCYMQTHPSPESTAAPRVVHAQGPFPPT